MCFFILYVPATSCKCLLGLTTSDLLPGKPLRTRSIPGNGISNIILSLFMPGVERNL
jgi:hypothetical protein